MGNNSKATNDILDSNEEWSVDDILEDARGSHQTLFFSQNLHTEKREPWQEPSTKYSIPSDHPLTDYTIDGWGAYER